MPRLTKRVLHAVKPDPSKEIFVWCSALRGFGARIYPSGKTVFIAQVRVGRAQRRVKIGPHGAFTVDQARESAEAAIRAAADGKEPVQVSITLPAVAGSNTLLYLPIYTPVMLPEVTVMGTTHTAVTWSKGGLSVNNPDYAGKFLDDGRYVAFWLSRWPIKATSVADPRFFAVTNVCGVSLDCDLDTDQDACDLGAIALCMNYTGIYPAGNIDFAYFAAAFNNAFNK